MTQLEGDNSPMNESSDWAPSNLGGLLVWLQLDLGHSHAEGVVLKYFGDIRGNSGLGMCDMGALLMKSQG